MKFQTFILFLISLCFGTCLYSQIEIKGIVMDAESQQGMIAASVYASNTKEGTITDFAGNFSLTTKDTILIVTYTGYTPQTVVVDSSFLTIKLNPGIELTEAIINIDASTILIPHKTDPSISTLKSSDIQINNEANIASSLNMVPGVFMHSGALNTNRITIRGIGNRNLFGTAKIKAYLDGIPLTNGSGETALENIDLSIIDAVTVYKGPASSIYGAGLGGMISLKVPDNIKKDGNYLSLQNINGSYGLAKSSLTFTRANYNRSVINLNFNGLRNNGYRDNNKFKRYGFNGFGKLNISDYESVTMLGSYTFLRGQIPSSLDSTDYVDNPTLAAFIWDRAKGFERNEHATFGVAYKAKLSNHVSQVSSIYGLFRSSYEVRPFNILNELLLSLGARTEWILDYDINGWLSNVGQGQRDHGDILSDNKERRNYSNLFAQAQLNVKDKAVLKVGLSRNYTAYEFEDFFLTDGDQSGFRNFPDSWSPFINLGLNLKHLLSLDQALSLSATVSHGFSPPSVEETFTPDGALNTAIIPEQGWNYELGIRGNINYKFNYHLSVYAMQIEDLIVARRTALDQFVGVNAGKTSHNGLELGLDYQQSIGNYNLMPFLRYTYADYTFKEFLDEEQNHAGNDLTGTAPHLFTAGLKVNSKRIYGNIIYRFVDAMPMRDDNSIYSEAYQLVNAKVGYQFNFSKDWTLDIFTGINNLFDEKYASMILINAGSFGGSAPRYFYPGLPRNFYLGLTVNFR